MANTNPKTIKKKRKVKNAKVLGLISLIASICLFAASGYFLYKTTSEVYTMVVLQKEIIVSEEILQKLKTENDELSNQKTKLEDPKYVTRFARGQFLLTKEGEKIFYLPSN